MNTYFVAALIVFNVVIAKADVCRNVEPNSPEESSRNSEIHQKSKEILISYYCHIQRDEPKSECLAEHQNSEELSGDIRRELTAQLQDQGSQLNTEYRNWRNDPVRVYRMLFSQADGESEMVEAMEEQIDDRSDAEAVVNMNTRIRQVPVLGHMISLMEATDRASAGCGEPVFFEVTNKDGYACATVTNVLTPKNIEHLLDFNRNYGLSGRMKEYWRGKNCSTFEALNGNFNKLD